MFRLSKVLERIPTKPDTPSGSVERRFIRLSEDPFLVWLARLSERVEGADFRDGVRRCEFRRSPWWQGGFAGADEAGGRVVLAICEVHPLHFVMDAAANHELFHFARHFRGVTPLLPPRKYGRPRMAWEEIVVWSRTLLISPLGTSFYCLAFATAVLPIYLAVNAAGHWLWD